MCLLPERLVGMETNNLQHSQGWMEKEEILCKKPVLLWRSQQRDFHQQ